MKTGMIGCGNMAGAMIRGWLKTGTLEPDNLMASAKSESTKKRIREEYGINEGSNRETAAFADILFLAVKPIFYEEVLRETAEVIRPETVVVSLAPGKSLSWIAERIGREKKIIRTMPNTPAMVGEGMTGLCPNENVSAGELEQVLALCRCFGRAEIVPERLMDVVTGISGSSPAYVFMMIEAMADGAVADGMPRKQAYEFAAQAVLGSAKMVLETGMHPGALKDMVCSPGGTTIEAVRVLEEKGFRSALIEAVRACDKKAGGM